MKTGKHYFKFKPLRIAGNSWINIGIWLDDGKKPKLNDYLNKYFYGFVITEAQKLMPENSGSRDEAYGVKCKVGDIIEMFVNLDKRTIKYSINDKSYGIAYSNIKKGEYRALVHLFGIQDTMQLLEYKNHF